MKVKHAVPALAFSLLAATALAQEQAPAPVPAPEAVQVEEGEKVLIVGQRPGPGLWKVSNGDNVMWVFAKYGPLPKKMEWRSHEVEAILAKSQEYLGEPTSGAGIGWLGGLKMAFYLPQLVGMQNNPDGAKLQDVVPPETYARWLALKEKYVGKDDDIERQRPLFAASNLFKTGLERVGLTNKDQVAPVIAKLVKQSGIKATYSDYQVELKDAGPLLKDFKRGQVEDAACFAATLAQLEADIDHMRARANAWAIGDIDTIRKLDFGSRELACRNAIETSTAFKSRPELADLRAKSHELWLANAEKALAKNASTFAVLRMGEILAKDGLLARLEAKGYRVEAPE